MDSCLLYTSQGNPIQANVSSTLGRFLFNEILPKDLGFVNRTVPGNELLLDCLLYTSDV